MNKIICLFVKFVLHLHKQKEGLNYFYINIQNYYNYERETLNQSY